MTHLKQNQRVCVVIKVDGAVWHYSAEHVFDHGAVAEAVTSLQVSVHERVAGHVRVAAHN